MTAAFFPRTDVVELNHGGVPTGRFKVRAFLGERGVDFVAPTRDTLAEAEADAEKITQTGIQWWRVLFPSRAFKILAADEIDACDFAQQRWGGYPYAVEPVAA